MIDDTVNNRVCVFIVVSEFEELLYIRFLIREKKLIVVPFYIASNRGTVDVPCIRVGFKDLSLLLRRSSDDSLCWTRADRGARPLA